MQANFTGENNTFNNTTLDILQYPGNPNLQILKRPERINSKLLEIKMYSKRRPFDVWSRWPYGHAWESPGYIDMLVCENRPENHARLMTLSVTYGILIRLLTTREYVEEYQSVYEKPYPDGVLSCSEDYDYHTVKRMRHMIYFKRHEMSPTNISFVEGIGKIMNAGHPISDKQRAYIKGLLEQHFTFENQTLNEPYATLHKGTELEFKLPF